MATQFSALLLETLRRARRITLLTGAGVSAESGIPTFRDALTGLWAQFRPEDLATPEAFLAQPRRVWEWYAWRREKVDSVQPNPAHRAIALLQDRLPGVALITQNVDGLHQRAGSRTVIELHGNLQRVKCFDEDLVVDDWDDGGDPSPRCPQCGGLLRPDVVWFGENLPRYALDAAEAAARQCEVFFSIGTSGLVYPAAGLPAEAQRCGAVLVDINPDSGILGEQADVHLQGKAGEVLPALIEAAWGLNL
jgi:NAD-dependent deacetylase